MNLARSTSKIFIAKVLSSFVLFLGLTFFARNLGPHHMGVFFLFQAALGLLTYPADLGINTSLAKRLSEGGNRGRIITCAIAMKMAPLSALSIGILLLQEWINGYIGGEVAIFLVISLFLQEFSELAMEILRGDLRVGSTAFPVLLRQVFFVGTASILLLLNRGHTALMYGLIIGILIKLIVGVKIISINIERPSWSDFLSLFSYSKYILVVSVGGYFYNWMDIAVIGFFLSQSEVGVYEMAWRVSAIVMLFSSSLAVSIFPQMSKWDSENAKDRIEALLPKVITGSMLFVIPSFFGTLVLSREILSNIFGPSYASGWLVLIILMSEKPIQAIHIVISRSLQAIDRPSLAAKASLISIFINFSLNVILVSELGIVGAALATAVSFAVNGILHGFYLSKFISIDLPTHHLLFYIGASIIMAVIISIYKYLFSIDSILGLIVCVFLGVLVYSLTILTNKNLRSLIIGNAQKILNRKEKV